MGYCVAVRVFDVRIPGAKVPAAIEALRTLMSQVQQRGGGGTCKPGEAPVRHYSWVETRNVLNAIDQSKLHKALEEWRYVAVEEGEMTPLEQLATGEAHADVVVEYFSGEKLGDDEDLWTALAPFIDDGGTIEFHGEDDCRWRYVFVDGRLCEEQGHIVWA